MTASARPKSKRENPRVQLQNKCIEIAWILSCTMTIFTTEDILYIFWNHTKINLNFEVSSELMTASNYALIEKKRKLWLKSFAMDKLDVEACWYP